MFKDTVSKRSLIFAIAGIVLIIFIAVLAQRFGVNADAVTPEAVVTTSTGTGTVADACDYNNDGILTQAEYDQCLQSGGPTDNPAEDTGTGTGTGNGNVGDDTEDDATDDDSDNTPPTEEPSSPPVLGAHNDYNSCVGAYVDYYGNDYGQYLPQIESMCRDAYPEATSSEAPTDTTNNSVPNTDTTSAAATDGTASTTAGTTSGSTVASSGAKSTTSSSTKAGSTTATNPEAGSSVSGSSAKDSASAGAETATDGDEIVDSEESQSFGARFSRAISGFFSSIFNLFR